MNGYVEGGVVVFKLRDGRDHGLGGGNSHLVVRGGHFSGRDDRLGPRVGDDGNDPEGHDGDKESKME